MGRTLEHGRSIAAAGMLRAAAIAAGSLALAACVVYEPVPYQAASTYDRAWAAAIGAMQDQGVTINDQDRVSGVVRGTRGPTGVTAAVRTRSDGRVQVEFNTSGTSSDPALVERISDSYNRRMGR
ncbi:MAG TPA: hypothetical protein VFN64_09095 [Burkholderiaceae bacterium]|nr:hypothetical protein [Burkholderiaceae bacterium]